MRLFDDDDDDDAVTIRSTALRRACGRKGLRWPLLLSDTTVRGTAASAAASASLAASKAPFVVAEGLADLEPGLLGDGRALGSASTNATAAVWCAAPNCDISIPLAASPPTALPSALPLRIPTSPLPLPLLPLPRDAVTTSDDDNDNDDDCPLLLRRFRRRFGGLQGGLNSGRTSQ